MKKILLILLTFCLVSFTKPSQTFTIICKSGFIVGKWDKIEYYLPTGEEYRAVYDINLKYGYYRFINLDKSDTIPFAVTKEGVYKIGFQEDHPSFTILKNPIFIDEL
jgi:hypothetical protein